MNALAISYIESDFSSATETWREYRDRTRAPEGDGLFQRTFRRLRLLG